MKRRTTQPGRGFTLLEMLLAVAVLSMVGVLVAAMLSQARELVADNARRDASLTISRVTRLMNEQWSDRRSAVSMGGGGQTYLASPTEIGFVTTRAILNTDSPLVRVRYRIVADAASAVEDERRYDLVYEETRVFSAAAADAFQDEAQEAEHLSWEDAERHVLLRGCTEMAMERFRSVDQAAQEALEGERRGESGGGDSEARERLRAGGADAEQERLAELLDEVSAGWVRYDDASALPPAAVRISGKYQGEPFGCVFVGAALR